ncbi:substrate-binding domain-containing protein [uncultured Methylobacterium sp.]|uniref:substrate-binding domain-containing protein n=1 Tax=uncultured Methylobacterium sp. TaxID=157278 RepID=UPI0035C9ECB4
MILNRRTVLHALAMPLLVAAPAAEAATTDLVLACDTALAPVLSAAAERYFETARLRVRVFPTGPGLLIPQIARAVQNDLLFTQTHIMNAAATAKLLAGAPRGTWRNPLVLAAARGAGAPALRGRIAVSDPTPGSDMDGPAIITAMNLGERAILGVIDTEEVAFLIARGEAEAGLLHVSDVRRRPDLEVIRTVPAAVAPPPTYAVAPTVLARRPNPAGFIDFLISPEGRAALAAQGLETDA